MRVRSGKGQDKYLHRALDSAWHKIDFLLAAKRAARGTGVKVFAAVDLQWSLL
jgi:hypothetical protein